MSSTEDWAPAGREKPFAAVMEAMGVAGLVMPTIRGPKVSPVNLKVWIEPHTAAIKDGTTANYILS